MFVAQQVIGYAGPHLASTADFRSRSRRIDPGQGTRPASRREHIHVRRLVRLWLNAWVVFGGAAGATVLGLLTAGAGLVALVVVPVLAQDLGPEHGFDG